MYTPSDKKVLVCTNYRSNASHPSCRARGSDIIMHQLSKKNLSIPIEESPCMGLCQVGPNIRLVPVGRVFHEVSVDHLDEIAEAIQSD